MILGDKEYPTLYQWEAIEGVQTDLNEDSLDALYLTIGKLRSTPDTITRKEIANVMKVSKVVAFHGIRNYCLANNQPCPFLTAAHVGAVMTDIKEAMKEVYLFQFAMASLFFADDEEPAGNQTAEAITV